MNISVIIPVYNAQQFINRAIQSVLIQIEVIELILVEDGSSDNSLQICLQQEANESKVRVLRHPENKKRGVAATRNLGIKKAKGEYVAFLDADDYYLPNRFKQTQECFAADNKIDGVYEMVGVNSDSNEITQYSLIEPINPGELFESLGPIGDKVWFHIDGLTVKKSIFSLSGYFDESLKTSEDSLQWYKMAITTNLVGGEIVYPVALKENQVNGLSSNLEQTQKDFVLMWFKLFKWCKKMNCKNSRKELVLNKLYFVLSIPPYSSNWKGVNKIIFFIKIIIADPAYVLLRSKSFRRYGGNLIGYNRAINFLNKTKFSR